MTLDNMPFDEVNLRSYGSIGSLRGRELVQKICLSCGLVQPNDSRDVIIDVFFVLSQKQKLAEWISSKDLELEVVQVREECGLKLKGVAGSNIRRILKQLMDFGFIERESSKYRFIGFESPGALFNQIFDKRVLKIKRRIDSYFNKL